MLVDEIKEKALLLSEIQQQSTLDFMDSFLLDEEIDIDEYNHDIEEAEMEIKAGEFYTQDRAREMTNKWAR